MPVAAERVDFVVYDGTNSADIVALFEAGTYVWQVVSESGGVLTVESVEAEPDTYQFNMGDYAARRGLGGRGLHFSPSEFDAKYVELT